MTQPAAGLSRYKLSPEGSTVGWARVGGNNVCWSCTRYKAVVKSSGLFHLTDHSRTIFSRYLLEKGDGPLLYTEQKASENGCAKIAEPSLSVAFDEKEYRETSQNTSFHWR